MKTEINRAMMAWKRLFLIVPILVVAITASAAVVTPERAMQVAQSFVPGAPDGAGNADSSSKGNRLKKSPVAQTSEIVYTHYMPQSGRPAIYVVNLGNTFALVSADDVAHPILGYNDAMAWPTDGNLPPQVRSFLDDLAAQMEAASEQRQDTETAAEWQNPRRQKAQRLTQTNNLPDSVGPLLTTTWNQSQYYNALCPVDQNGPDGHVYAGCVAAAMAQVVNYWGQQQTLNTRGLHSYNTANYGTLTVDFDTVTYDFAHMPAVLTSTSTPQEVNAVAKLMYHCGVAVNMGYSPIESSAYTQDARAALINFFQFSPNMSFVEKALFKDAEWAQLIRAEVAANHPVMYSGNDTETESGHSFICDGYKQDNYFHFNFGWGGLFDGWFLLNAINPTSYKFNSSQNVIIGIVPTTAHSVILGQMKGNSTFVVDDEPMEFYHIMGHNTYEGIGYLNKCTNNVLFVSSDDTKQLVFDIVTHEDQNVSVLDGPNGTTLRSLRTGAANDLSPVVASADKLQLNYEGNFYYSGFHYMISQYSDCRTVSNIASAVDTTAVHLTWTENGTATQWEIEYGPKGFTHGEGTTYIANTNNATFTNLPKFSELDFYIRPVCGDNEYGYWSQVSLMVEARYWQDIVTAQPAGYVINQARNAVEVSTAEGLTWWAKNDANSRDLYLTADIDLAEYKWKPVSSNKNIYGQGHVISNGYIHENTIFVGLLADYRGDAHDLGLTNFKVIGETQYTAGLCGRTQGTIDNCYVINSIITGKDHVGGIAGQNTWEGSIVNSFVNVDVIGERWTGLMVGSMNNNTSLQNCYAAGGLIMRGFCYNAGIVAYAIAGKIRNCYSVYTQMGVVGYKGGAVIADTSLIQQTAEGCVLEMPISFDGESETDLMAALNKGVQLLNDTTYRTWVADVNDINGGFPVLGAKHVITCPNVSEVSLQNIQVDDNPAVAISWTENGNATQWRIRYRRHDQPDSAFTYHPAMHNPDTIYGLPLGFAYDFGVQAICDTEHKSGWSETTFIVDIPHWTDIVTSQPAGYSENSAGEIEISSPEGLAWLAVKVNGLHGQQRTTYENKAVKLTADIDLAGYRWTPIGREWRNPFRGVLDGQNHSISNIYVNEGGSYLGLIGAAENASFKNIALHGGSVSSIDNNSSQVGGLVGYATGCQEISNCHSSVGVYANEKVGALGGYIYNTSSQTIISNCSASGIVYGRQGAGGLIGSIYGDVVVRNCYATGDVDLSNGSSNGWYRGALIGNIMRSSVENVYATGTVRTDATKWYYGKVLGCPDTNRSIHYIYGQTDVSVGMQLLGLSCSDVADTTQFRINGDTLSLMAPVSINEKTYTDLLAALNGWVTAQNDPALRTWVRDGETGYPVFGDYFVPSCSNPTNLIVSQATVIGDTVIQTQLAWNQIGEPEYWEIGYVASGHSISEATVVTAQQNPFTLTGIPTGEPLDFYVRAICSTDDVSQWSGPIVYVPDKLRWTEVVTSQPAGYQEDQNGNILISSAEGLAWLSSVANGLNGIAYDRNRFAGKTISLLADVDMSAYRWTPIGPDGARHLRNVVFIGNGHTISGLYANELADHIGLFGYVIYGSINDLCIKQSRCYGENYVGTIVGEADAVSITNCAVEGAVRGIQHFGGLAGYIETGQPIANCCFVGTVEARQDISTDLLPRYFGGLCGSAQISIINCYLVCPVQGYASQYAGIIAGGGYTPELISNCYYKAYDSALPVTSADCDVVNTSSFNGNGTTWTLNTPPFVNGAFRTDLLDALNAWVDANNTEDQYRHWAADTTNANGGFPVLAVIPKYSITFVDENGTVLQCDTLEQGSMPAYIGATPTKASTAQYEYTFAGWTPAIVAVTGEATYTATYTSELRKYMITFVDEDGTVLQADYVEYGAMPTCDDPTKEEDEQYIYTFAGWTPEIVAVIGEATYTATYTATAKPEGIDDVEADIPVQKIFREGTIFILRGDKTYTATGQELK